MRVDDPEGRARRAITQPCHHDDARHGIAERSRPGNPRRARQRELTGRGGLADAWHAADQLLTPEWNTYSGYRAPRAGGRRIDWLLGGGGLRVLQAGVNATRFDGRAASDHEPVQALLRLPAIPV